MATPIVYSSKQMYYMYRAKCLGLQQDRRPARELWSNPGDPLNLLDPEEAEAERVKCARRAAQLQKEAKEAAEQAMQEALRKLNEAIARAAAEEEEALMALGEDDEDVADAKLLWAKGAKMEWKENEEPWAKFDAAEPNEKDIAFWKEALGGKEHKGGDDAGGGR